MNRKLVVAVLACIVSVCMVAQSSIVIAASGAQTQTLTIYGAQGTSGEQDPYTEFSKDGGTTWQRAYLYSGHPWGLSPETNNWLNCGNHGQVCLFETVLYRVQFVVPPAFLNPQITVEAIADDYADVRLNGLPIGTIVGQDGFISGDEDPNGALQAGLNEFEFTLYDITGGLVGLNFTIGIQVEAQSPLYLVDSSLEIPSVVGNPGPDQYTTGNVMVSVDYPDGTAATEYSLDGVEWLPYASDIVMTDNGTVYARWRDAKGDVSPFGAWEVSNIDRTPPPQPSLQSAYPYPTNGPVTVGIGNWGDAAVKEYRINGGDWQEVPVSSAVTMTDNGTVEARGKDALGNESEIGLIHIGNIVADPNLLQITHAAISVSGTEVGLQFNRELNRALGLNLGKFHLNGADSEIVHAMYSSGSSITLMLSDPVPESATVTLYAEAGAVYSAAGTSLLDWHNFVVQPRQQVNEVRTQVLAAGGGSPGDAVRMSHVAHFVRAATPADVTGDGLFDRADVIWLLMQIDRTTAVGSAAE